ncbi:LysR family transcriptional regulator [Segatella paludivivens]|uniref:LysR family transcriptional regulator n=1 Tax=Segatella paludivivens TaxID=185294 RepID=UPI00138DEECE|nr:LysR family transcriptional regulator [Segatella paludivivens]
MKYFVKLAEELNFTVAARKLFITQSTLSLSIKKLEEECGMPLFDRIGKCTYLTDSGRIFAEFARRAIKDTEDGMRSMKEINGIYTGRLHIGVTYSLHDILNDCILLFTEQFPEAGLRIIESDSVKELEELVLKGEIDFAFTYSSKRMSTLLECTKLFETPLCVIASKNHEIAKQSSITMNGLRKYPFVLFPYGIHSRMEIEHMFVMNNEPILVPRIEVNDASLILRMVETGRWLTILSEGIVAKKDNFRAIRIAGVTNNLTCCIVRPKDKYLSTLERKFCDIIKSHWM